jgi:methionyl-tRNA formyltransferase
MSRILRILLVGEEAAGAQVVALLHETPHQLVAVLTDGAERGNTSRLRNAASRFGHQVWPAKRVKEVGFAEVVRGERVDLLLNVHALHVLPWDLVTAPRIGSFNLHPGPLPQYAGLNAPSWAIYHGERTHGVTVHWMDAGIDTGLIAFDAPLEVEEDETGLSLSAKCVRTGMYLIRDLLNFAATDAVPRKPQRGAPGRYYGREVPQHGWLVWSKPAYRMVNFVRACDFFPFTSPWGHPRSILCGREIEVLKACRTEERTLEPPGTVGRRVEAGVLVAAADEWVLVRSVRIGGRCTPAGEVLHAGERLEIPPHLTIDLD